MSNSGFYAWQNRQVSQRALDDQELLKKITKIFIESEGRYGSPRVYKALKAQGLCVGRKRVERLMRTAGLRGRVVRVTHRNPGLKKYHADGKNLLLKIGKPTAVNQQWVGDITYLKVRGKWRYLATVMDLYSRRIIGWSLSKSRSMVVTCTAYQYAMKKRGYPKGVIFHTDRGIEYRGSDFQDLLRLYDSKHSMNRPGQCTDNAFMESFYHSLKAELIRGNIYKSTASLRRDLATYINGFYNMRRLHSGLDYVSPCEYERYAA